jgi:hypothetical protein
MNEYFLDVDGTLINSNAFKIIKSIQMVKLFLSGDNPFITLIETKCQEDGTEVIIFDAEVELGQRVFNDIRPIERVALLFNGFDIDFPEVLVLRRDFPRVPHLNLRLNEFPRSLCLYDKQYSEMKMNWTPIVFIERIREWLALTAKGKLHNENQPLEPFFSSPVTIIMPNEFFSVNYRESTSFFAISSLNKEGTFLKCVTMPSITNNLPFIGCIIQGEPQNHGIIYNQPESILSLHEILKDANIDLIAKLRTQLDDWNKNKPHPGIYEALLMIIIVLPKRRETNDKVEISDIWVFLCPHSIKEIGIEIGLWQLSNGVPGILFTPDSNKIGDQLNINIARPISAISKEFASLLSGIEENNSQIVLIGTGALGSQIYLNLIRMGYGKWTLIDNDLLFPHNVTRHALPTAFVGHNKAVALQNYTTSLFNDYKMTSAFACDILQSSLDEEVNKSLNESDIILDISTSIAVARYISSDLKAQGRRISMFMNPTGYDVVMLCEDRERRTTLDYIEMQYYRFLTNNVDILKDHLIYPEVIQYSQSCRDVSNTIPEDLVALQSSICSRALQTGNLNSDGSIQIWRTCPSTFTVKHHYLSLEQMILSNHGDWIICTDVSLINKIYQCREDKLPNETGGILIGSFDMERKIVYVVDTIPSPPDSKEWPTLYIRGYQGLERKLKEIDLITAGNLYYVGEWHSHPKGYGCLPSNDDKKAFHWLQSHMSTEGKPAIMMIAGDKKQYAWYLAKI